MEKKGLVETKAVSTHIILYWFFGKIWNNPLNLEEKLPTDRGVKTRYFTRITDVTTEGGDDNPIKTIEVSKRPFIFDNTDLSEDEGKYFCVL